ncbi:MAG: type 4a pilus biogenesis protein PilO [Candidatus Paceibacterota bacterium]|jgi:hypothetical protein
MDVFKKKITIEGLITAIIIIAISGGIYFFASKITAYSNEILTLRTELALRSSSLTMLANLRSEYISKAQKDFTALQNIIPVKDQLINIAKDFQFIATQAGFDSTFSFMSESPATVNTLGFLSFKLTFGGDFDKLLEFVKTLQDFRYLSDFTNFTITRGKDKAQLSVNGKVFFRLP